MEFLIRHRGSWMATVLITVAILVSSPVPAKAQDDSKLQLYEQSIKAGLVYNFLKYTTWPGTAPGRLRVCLYGGNPLDGNLSLLEGRTAQQATINIVYVDSINELVNCSLVFIDKNQKESLSAILSSLNSKHILTVSDMGDFAQQGGMVELTSENRRIALYINKRAVDHAGLIIQARILKLAKLVSG